MPTVFTSFPRLSYSCRCLQCVIEGCGPNFNSFVDRELLTLIETTLTHTNRFVRETGYYVCAALVGCNRDADGSVRVSLERNMIFQHGDEFAQHLARGLADNWSQVRLAASTATRSFLAGLDGGDARENFYELLLPPLCLNRCERVHSEPYFFSMLVFRAKERKHE